MDERGESMGICAAIDAVVTFDRPWAAPA